MIGFYNYTVYLTYLGLISAVCGIGAAFSGSSTGAVLCLLFSGFCDLFDGKVARTKKDRTEEEKKFGIQIDSLSDIVCFGVLPASIGFSLGLSSTLQFCAMTFFVLAGLIRLAYFNVTEESRQQKTSENRKEYLGLPITASALIVPLLMCFASRLGEALPAVYSAVLFLTGLCYIAPFRIRKPGKAGAAVMIVVGAAVLLFLIFGAR